MIFSFGLILLIGFLVGWLLNKINIPGLVGMIVLGLIIGPFCLNLIDDTVLNVSSELRQIALVIILTRSGLNINLDSLKKIGRPAFLMCFVPATFEIVGVCLLSVLVLKVSVFEGLLLGSVLSAVSPAVVSPRMIKLIDHGFGEEHEVPKLILAGSSVDDIYVIVLFYAFLGLVENNSFDALSLLNIPLSIVLGIILGVIVGFILSLFLKYTHFRMWGNTLIVLATSFLMIALENVLKPYISISSLLGIMVVGMVLLFKLKDKAKDLSNCYNNMWIFFEIILFVLVGATIDFSYAISNFFSALLIIMGGLVFRTVGVIVSLIKTKLTFKEKLFTILAYIPKATVQASIGGIALAHGLECGAIVLTVSVVAILITAPLGAFFIDFLGKKLLTRKEGLPTLTNEEVSYKVNNV